MARQWLLPEVWAAFLLEFQADVGHQEDWIATGTCQYLCRGPDRPWLMIVGQLCVSVQLCPSAPLQKVWAGSVWQMFFQTFHHPPDGLWIRGARVRQLLRVHHWRRVGNSHLLFQLWAKSLGSQQENDFSTRKTFSLSFLAELPRRPFTTASTVLFTCTTKPPLEICWPLAPTRSSRSECLITPDDCFC